MAVAETRSGNFQPVSAKQCRCGRRGEWAGRLCPDCRPQTGPVTPLASLVRPEPETHDLSDLARAINDAHRQVMRSGREMVEHAIRAGEALVKARSLVPRGQWIDWATNNVQMHITSSYRYMRMAEHRDLVLASDVESIEAAIQLLADQPRRGHGPRRYSDADKADWVRLADEIGIKPAALAVGVSPSTIHKWTSVNSPSRGQTRQSREVTEDRIDRVSAWLVARFGGVDYPRRVNEDVRIDAAKLVALVFEIGASDAGCVPVEPPRDDMVADPLAGIPA